MLPPHQAFDLQCTRNFCHFIHDAKLQYITVSQNVKLRKFSDAFVASLSFYQSAYVIMFGYLAEASTAPSVVISSLIVASLYALSILLLN
jgi:hypothetical protein